MSEIQSVVFNRKLWCDDFARKWLKKEGYRTSFPNDNYKKYSTQYRFRQTDPKQYKNFTTKKIMNNKIMLIIGHK